LGARPYLPRLRLATAPQAVDRERSWAAYAGRYTGLSEAYGQPVLPAATREHWDAVSAHYAGQAIRLYVETGDPEYLPNCLSARTLAALPRIGDDSWRAKIAFCG